MKLGTTVRRGSLFGESFRYSRTKAEPFWSVLVLNWVCEVETMASVFISVVFCEVGMSDN
ncbi:hypothetical protein QJS10_CPB19g00903 [Acorus calamus]|uniref:Uncharacterized protein n=1 Tax=Acorus calamus TaxID=4465 RepID=A0AAV9CDM1_ACOCL|nr:hypothetical protein QJS10_CPB19g00903 [Acorus calamus]